MRRTIHRFTLILVLISFGGCAEFSALGLLSALDAGLNGGVQSQPLVKYENPWRASSRDPVTTPLRDWGTITTFGSPTLGTIQICVRDHEFKDGDILDVSVDGRRVFSGEILNRRQCVGVSVTPGRHEISVYAMNGSGLKGNCDYGNRNTGEISVSSSPLQPVEEPD